MPGREITLHLISDSTGETVRSAVEAAASQFGRGDFRLRLHNFVRSEAALDAAFAGIAAEGGGLIVFTMADDALRASLMRRAAGAGLRAIDILAPIMIALGERAGQGPLGRPGEQHRIDGGYLDRIAAIEFALASDDGAGADRLTRADVILIGASRTSKTPTCVYLANQGVRAANVPLLPGEPLPEPVLQARRAGVAVVALTASPQRLAQVRRQRLDVLESTDPGGYAELERIREEVTALRLLCERHGIPVIDVTRRSIEETAASIRALLPQAPEKEA
ncbi:MAG: kinase/pyrophosphorylase [Alphaproteobacteria bacterium]|nr:MAG: kinase/pyrophosphorylase [Alphaproteobacteria bacterium]